MAAWPPASGAWRGSFVRSDGISTEGAAQTRGKRSLARLGVAPTAASLVQAPEMRAEAAPPAPQEVALLRKAGLRLTPQRLAIAREILSRSHPTVGEVFEAVRRQFPTIGLATVYATFNIMAERGLVRALPFADAVRYDANLSPHANLVCTRCGRITDFDRCDDVLAILRERTAAATFQLQEERIDLYGLCRACQEPARSPTARTSPD
jgi:Fur family transcriptional regulator, peroxide stress response regulator